MERGLEVGQSENIFITHWENQENVLEIKLNTYIKGK